MTMRRRGGRKTERPGQQTFEPAEDRLYLAFFKPYMVHSQFTRELEEHRTWPTSAFRKTSTRSGVSMPTAKGSSFSPTTRDSMTLFSIRGAGITGLI